MYIYIYIEREREREKYRYMAKYICFRAIRFCEYNYAKVCRLWKHNSYDLQVALAALGHNQKDCTRPEFVGSRAERGIQHLFAHIEAIEFQSQCRSLLVAIIIRCAYIYIYIHIYMYIYI